MSFALLNSYLDELLDSNRDYFSYMYVIEQTFSLSCAGQILLLACLVGKQMMDLLLSKIANKTQTMASLAFTISVHFELFMNR